MNTLKYFLSLLFILIIQIGFGQVFKKSTEEVQSNEAIVNMVRSKISKKIIFQKIDTGQNNFDISSDGLIKLKASMISDDIVLAMIKASQSKEQDVLTNEKVIDMFTNKVSTKIILLKIETSKNDFDTSSDALIKLKSYKLWDSIIMAIMTPQKGKSEVSAPAVIPSKKFDFPKIDELEKIKRPGIYFFDRNGNKMIKLDPVLVEQVNTRSGVILNNASVKVGLSSSEANFQFSGADISFYFITNYEITLMREEEKKNLFEIMESPNEISLAKFRVSRNKREIEVGKVNPYSVSYGVSDSYSVNFKYEKLTDNIFKIYFNVPLKKGQYCFIPPVSSVSRENKITVYDFGVE